MKKQIWIIGAVIFCFVGCSSLFESDEKPDGKKELSRKLTTHEKQIVSSGETFGYNLFRQTVDRDTTQNVFISPLSVTMALGMTLNGAAGDTRQEMKRVLSLEQLSMPEINSSYATLIKLLREADPRVKMRIANSVWIREGFPTEKAFKDTCKEFFEARIESLDFSSPSAKDRINQWVSNNTEQLIESIIEGRIPAETVMYLINAIYFKGNWQYEFDPDDTQSGDFTLESGAVRQTEMMTQKADLATYITDEVQLVDLPYGDSLFTMTLMMPGDSKVPLETFIQDELTAQNVGQWISAMTVQPTRVSVPKFEMEYKLTMNRVLKNMGMAQAFNPREADFSHINPAAQLFINEVKHKSFLKVDEKGTEAAAVTSVGIGVTSTGPDQVRTINFNRPFVFIIRERTSGTILFMGKMMNPEN